MGLLNELQQQGLLSPSETKVAEGLNRAKRVVSQRNVGGMAEPYTNNYLENTQEQLNYLDTQISKQQKRYDETGILSYNNLNSSNPLVAVGSNILNAGVQTAGSLVDLATSTAGGINVSNANSLYSNLPNDIKDLYQREQNEVSRAENNTALQGYQNAINAGQLNELVGYNKQFKTRTELDNRIRELQAKVNSKPLSPQELSRLDSPDGNVMVQNSLLTPLRSSYRDIFNQINTNYADARRWEGDKEKGVDNFFGSRAWGNDSAMQDFSGQYQDNNASNKTLNQQGQFQRANSRFGSDEWLEGVGKSWDAFKGSVPNAANAIVDNPSALIQVAAQTAPYLIGRTANAALTGGTLGIVSQGSQAIAERNGTPAIDGFDAVGNAAAAGAWSGLGMLERSILLGQATRSTGQAVERATEGVRSAAGRVTDKLSDAVPAWVDRSAKTAAALTPTRTAGRVATAAAYEGATEMLQTQIENSWSKGQTDVDVTELAQAGVLGAALGGAFAVPSSAIEAVTQRTANRIDQRVEETIGNPDTTTDDLLNVSNPAYAPAKVINRIMAEELPNQNYEQARQRINEVVQSTGEVLNSLEQEIKQAENPDALLQRITRGNEILEEFRANNTPETNPNYQAIIDNYSGQIGGLQTQYDLVTSPEYSIEDTKANYSRIQEALVEMEGPYKQFNDAMSGYQESQAPTEPAAEEVTNADGLGMDDSVPVTANDLSTESVSTESQEVNAPVEDVNTEAVRHLGAPTPSNLARIQELSEDTALPEATRRNLRVVADALLKANQQKDIGTVNKDVSKGSQGFRGTVQYIDEMAKAIESGDTGRQEALGKQMQYFVASRESKLNAIQQAQVIADQTNKQVQVYKEDQGGWKANDSKPIPRSQFDKNNGILVNPRTAKGRGADALVEAISDELDLITSTSQALQAMRNSTALSANSELNALRDGYMTDRNTSPIEVDPMQQALDDFNTIEREIGRDTTARDTDPKVVTKAAKEVKATAKPEPEPEQKKEKFNRKTAFKDKAKAQKYLERYKQTANYHVITDDKGNATLRKKPKSADQPAAPTDATVVTANEHDSVYESIQAAAQVSESATEATQTQSVSQEPITTYEENTDQEIPLDTSPEGAISTLDTQGKSYKEVIEAERSKPYRLQNLLKSSFVQRIKDGFNSPLVVTPDFISTVKTRSRKAIVDMVVETTGEQPSEQQILLVNDFMNFNKGYGLNDKISKAIKANKNPEYNYKYYSDFLLNEQGRLDENVATAVSLAMYSWIGESANSIYADNQTLSKILGVKNVDGFPPSVSSRLGTVGTHQKTLAASLGQRIYQTLQLKLVKDVSPDRQAKLEQMLGTLAIGVMVNEGLADRSRVTNGELYAMTMMSEGKLDDIDPNLWQRKPDKSVDMTRLNNKAMTYFIRPAAVRNKEGFYVATNFNKRISKMHEGTKGILSKIFNFDPYTSLPSLEPITTLPATYNDFSGRLPSMVKDALLAQQSRAYKLNVPMLEVTEALMSTAKGTKTLQSILGFQDPNNSHKAFEESIHSVNEGINRSLRLLDETYQHVGDQDFFLQSTIWSNFRNGNVAGFNPQGDKLHRGYVSLKNDEITVPLTEDNALFDNQGELTEYGMFLRGLAFRMEDVKIQGNAVDKTLLGEFLPAFRDYINSPEVRNAADALQRVMDGTNNATTDLDQLSDLLGSWEMGALGLSALMAINTRNQAMNNGAKSFTVMMAADSDGLVNGPAITNVLMNSADKEFYQSIGVIPFAEEGQEQITSMQQWRKTPGALDPYEQLAILQKQHWSTLPRDNSPMGKAVRALDYLDSAYGKRAGAKRALTPFNYGAGFDSVNRANARGTLESVYKAIESAGRNYLVSPEDIANKAKAINALIDYHNSLGGKRVEHVSPSHIANMDNLLSTAQENAIRNADINLRGSTTTVALTEAMADYIELRNGKTSLANSLFEVYNAIYESKKETMEQQNDIDVTDEGLSADKLQQLLRESFDYMPTLATPMGIKSKEVNTSGIPLIDIGKHWNELKNVEVKFDASFGHIFTEESSSLASGAKDRINASTTLKSDIREKVFESPGVGSIALFIQSHDAFITYSVMQAMQAQNFHDANSTNAYDLNKMAKVQNKAFLEAATISHMGKAFIDATLKSLTGYANSLNEITDAKQGTVLSVLTKTLETNGVSSESFAKGLPELIGKYLQSDIDKLTMLSQQHSISQYATEGGAHLITADDRKAINAEKSRLEKLRDKYVTQATELGKTLDKGIVVNKPTKPEAVTAEQLIVDEVVQANQPVDSFRKDLMDNKEAFKDPKELIKHVKRNLAKYLHQQGNQGKYATMFTELLNLTEQAMPDNLQVNIIDGTESTSDVIGYDQAVTNGTSAWFVSDNGKNQINLRMDNNDVNSKVIVHEFIHAATSNAIDTVRANPGKYPKTKESLDKLDRLLDHVKTKVNSSSDPVIKYGVTNIDEFIATGLTYPKFMDFLDSITDVPVEKRGMNRIATAFRSLVSNVLDVLYAVAGKGRKYNPKVLSAYEALLLDTAEFVSRSKDLNNTQGQVKLLGAPREQAINTVSEYTAKEVYEALDDGTLNPEFKKQLGDLISNTTDRLFAALPNSYARTSKGYSLDQIWINALQSGKAPYTTAAIKAGYKLSAQEQFSIEAIEVTMQEVTKRGSVSTAYRTVANAYEEASKTLQPSDFHKGNWDEASPDQKKLATEKYNYIFRTGKADYITRFTAMALGSQEVNSLLTMKLKSDLLANKGESRFEKLIDLVNRVTNSTVETLTRTSGLSTVQAKLPMLAQMLVEIDLKNRNKAVNLIESSISKAEDVANATIISTRDKLNDALGSPLSAFDNRYINIVKNTLKATKNGRSAISVFDAVRDFNKHENPNKRLGFLGELANEIGEQNDAQRLGEKLLAYAKQNEGTAQRIRTVVSEDTLSHFESNGENLTYESRSATTSALLRTDAQSLLSDYGYDKVMQMIDSRTLVNKEIISIEKGISNQAHINRAKSLAWYMVSGKGNETLAKNARAIAQDAGLFNELQPTSEEYVASLDKLISLYAIKYTDAATLKEAHKVMVNEASRPDKGGTYALMRYHESLARDSYNELFKDNPLSYIKGYLPNIMNPHKEVVVATSAADKDRLKAAMYVELGTVNKSYVDPTQSPAVMYYTEDAGNQRYISGAVALYNYGRKGTEITLTVPERVKAINMARRSMNTSPDFDPRKEEGSKAIPTYDTAGKIVAFNYEMTNHVRDTYLERNNDFSDIVGEYTAAGFNKVTQKDQNINVMDALIDEYRTNMRKDPKAYIYVGAGAVDPVLGESWALIPQEVRDHIYKRTGLNGIYVHNQAYLTVFGSKKYSLTETFDKHREQQNISEKLFTGFMKGIFRDNARIRTAQGERMWQEMVTTLKDFIVIRNVSTAVINIISNSFLLMAHGVSPVTLVKDTIEAVKAGGEYRKYTAEMIKLQNRQRIDVGNADAIQQRIEMLQQRIERNPLIDVINANMFSGIVEDIDADNDSYTYMSGIQKKYEKQINKVPKSVRNVAKHAFVQPGTPLYQFLHSATQYGDFSAKYSLYKHYRKEGPNQLSHDKAVEMAQNNFINYDVPTSKGMQYANDMGLFMFTKYNLRIQRALFNLLAKRPASAIGQAIIVNALTRLPYGIDPLVFNQIGNPLREGAFGLFSALDEPFPIQMVTDVF